MMDIEGQIVPVLPFKLCLSTIPNHCFFVILAISYCPLFLLDGYMAGGITEKTPFEFPLPLFLLHYEV
jgi:hypothetical protein